MNFAHRVVQIIFVEKTWVISPRIAHFRGISNHKLINSLGGVSHITSALKMCLFQEERYSSTMIQMKTIEFYNFMGVLMIYWVTSRRSILDVSIWSKKGRDSWPVNFM